MIRSRSPSVIAAQVAISSIERLHPAHNRVSASITHTLMHGVSMNLAERDPGNKARDDGEM
jgi:hypothetical protein